MKRRVTTTEYFDNCRPSKRSRVDRILDYLLSDKMDADEFYPPDQKRHYYEDTDVLLTLSFNNGILYGGCCTVGCPRKCVPLSEFRPREASGYEAFDCMIPTYEAALSARDKDVASETRAALEQLRSRVCSTCSQPSAANIPAASPVHTSTPEESRGEGHPSSNAHAF
jgi:hypothetical protein|eukprot:5712137-Prymnesium_polylepis.1